MLRSFYFNFFFLLFTGISSQCGFYCPCINGNAEQYGTKVYELSHDSLVIHRGFGVYDLPAASG